MFLPRCVQRADLIDTQIGCEREVYDYTEKAAQ